MIVLRQKKKLIKLIKTTWQQLRETLPSLYIFFICYLAVSRPIGHYWGDSLTHLMLIIGFHKFQLMFTGRFIFTNVQRDSQSPMEYKLSWKLQQSLPFYQLKKALDVTIRVTERLEMIFALLFLQIRNLFTHSFTLKLAFLVDNLVWWEFKKLGSHVEDEESLIHEPKGKKRSGVVIATVKVYLAKKLSFSKKSTY